MFVKVVAWMVFGGVDQRIERPTGDGENVFNTWRLDFKRILHYMFATDSEVHRLSTLTNVHNVLFKRAASHFSSGTNARCRHGALAYSTKREPPTAQTRRECSYTIDSKYTQLWLDSKVFT